MTYLEIIALINQWIITNGNREITAAVLNPVLRAMTEFVRSVTGDLANLNTSNNDNLVSAINEVNTALANVNINGSQVYYGEPNPNTTPPPFFKPGDFYLQEDIFNDPVALFVYDGFVWRNLTATLPTLQAPLWGTAKRIRKGYLNTNPITRDLNEAGDLYEMGIDAENYSSLSVLKTTGASLSDPANFDHYTIIPIPST